MFYFYSMASSRTCHQGPCGPCSLCRHGSTKFTHAESLDVQQYQFLCEVENTTIDKSACICYACSKQLKRNVGNTKFRPRWKQNSRQNAAKCSIQSCEHTAHKSTTLATATEIEQLIGQPIVAFNVEQDESSVSLCQAHYNYLYSQLTLPTPCESCGEKPKRGEKFNRHCPEPDSINTYLSIVTSDPSHLTDKSLVCTACYQHFRVIVGNIRKGKAVTPSHSRKFDAQRNADIDKLISSLSSQASAYLSTRESATLSDYLEFVACLVGKKVGERMKSNEAMLLPAVHKEFADEALAHVSMFPNVGSISEHDIPTTRWLLSRLHVYFEDHIEVQCRHKRRTRRRLESGYSMCSVAANARQAALQIDASAGSSYMHVDLDATV